MKYLPIIETMKSNLIDKVIEEYIKDSLSIADRNIFVLPSKRSVFYAKNKVKEIYQSKGISGLIPDFITINEFIENLTSLVVLSKTDLIYRLYLSYQKIFDKEVNPYHDFLKWASMLLNDFHDVVITYPDNTEKQKQIFTNLKDIKEIEHWSLNHAELSENQKKYLDLMNKFYEIFSDFNNELLKDGYAYSALAYQKAVNIIKGEFESNQYLQGANQFIFIGFNALTEAEKIILTKLKENNKIKLYWDYDKYYTENENHEAGKFLRENFKLFNLEENNQPSESYFDKHKTITIASGTNDAEEALFVKKVLTELQKENPELHNTAIILNKPENLNLILTAVPDNVKYNVSSEYPLYLTSVYQFLMQILRIFLHLRKNQSNVEIYHKHLIALLLNPFFKNYFFIKFNITEYHINQIVNNIKNKNIIYISNQNQNIFSETHNEQFKNDFSEFLKLFNTDKLSDIVLNVNKLFEEYLKIMHKQSKKDLFSVNVVQTISEQLNRIEELVITDNNKVIKDIKDLYAFIQQVVSKESVAFKGEPMCGLQIIGLLESRLLDFENIIIPFMNEGAFPPDHHKISFLPYDLRFYYQLPTHYNDDAIFSYLFYRNIHASHNIYLSFNNAVATDEKGLHNNTGEQSRYIQQIRYELSHIKNNIQVNYYTIEIKNRNVDKINQIVIDKDDEILSLLKNISYSPSSISTYLECPLKFYFQYILKLKKSEEASEEIEADIEGTIFHSIMSKIYSEVNILNEKNNIDLKKLEELINNKNKISELVESELKPMNLDLKGKVLIQEEILTEEITRFLKKEKEFIEKNPVKIIYTENKGNVSDKKVCVETDVIDNEEEKINVSLTGIPDRIDLVINDNLLRIVDYKSSFNEEYDKMEFIVIDEDFFNKEKSNTIKKQLQLLIYLYFVLKQKEYFFSDIDPECKKLNCNITGVILPLRIKLKSEYQNSDTNNQTKKHNKYLLFNNDMFKVNYTDYNTNQNFVNIENNIRQIFNRILSIEYPFHQTTNNNTCKYCDFNNICKK